MKSAGIGLLTRLTESRASDAEESAASEASTSPPINMDEYCESPVIINPDVFVQRLKPYVRRKASTYRRPPRRRPILCIYCIFGQHESCECEACTCAGEFRHQHVEERNPQHSKEPGGPV